MADWVMNIPFAQFKAATEAAVPIGLQRGADHVRGVAVTRAPVGETGHLTGDSGATTHGAGADTYGEVKFPGPYGAVQNRGMRADGTHIIRNRPGGGQTGFLTQTMVDQRDAVLDIIADVIRELS